jgi:hypothetical protein
LGCMGHQSKLQTGAPALNMCALLPGMNSAVLQCDQEDYM